MATNDPTSVERPHLSDSFRPLTVVLGMVAIMWAVEIIDFLPIGGDFDRFGIRPRRFSGLDGILFAPFLHSGFLHLIANTIPFLVLGSIIALGGAGRFLSVTAIVAVVSGLATWLVSPANSDHVGASGLVFGYVTYLIGRGWFERRIGYLLGGLVVVMVYGSVLWGVVPRPGISWQMHLFGAAGGVIAARLLHGSQPERPSLPA
jgi:membrane associated rhomboid family serine protease